MTWLMRWQPQPGEQIINSTSESAPQIVWEAGYECAPAFNRAFQGEFGVPLN